MEVKKKIKLVYFLISVFSTLCFVSCSSGGDTLFIHDPNFQDPIQLNKKDVEFIKDNIYRYQNKLHLAVEHAYPVSKLIGKGLYLKTEIVLMDSIDQQSVNEIVDVASYEEIVNKLLYIDKNNVYFFQKARGCYLCLELLDLKPNAIKILDDTNEYATDGNKVFCLRYGEEIKTKFPKTFHTIKVSGNNFGIDSTSIYSMCESMSPYEFKQKMDHIPIAERDSIIRTYFPEINDSIF